MKNGFYLFCIFIIGCTSNQTPKQIQGKSSSAYQIDTKQNPTTHDSLNDYTSYYYRSNISTKDFAELYLKDSILTNDYKKLYDCLDSLSSDNLKTRNYYFKVLIKSLDNLEEVFHQNMGLYLVKNIDKFKDELFGRLSVMNDDEIKFFAQGIEMYISKTSDKGEKWLMDLKLMADKSTPDKSKKLNLLIKDVELSMNDSIE
jgi:hypothetical protein